MLFRKAVALAILVPLSSCANSGGEPKTPDANASGASAATFTYLPILDKPFRETMTRYQEVSIAGTPIREGEEWTMVWEVMNSRETNLYKRSMRLTGFKVKVNGLDILRGDEVFSSKATIDILTDKDSNVVDVRGTDEFSAALVGLGSAEAQPELQRMFSPEFLKALVVTRIRERHSDFVGRPAQVGSQWLVSNQGDAASRQIRVTAETPCGSRKCVSVVREYDVDRQSIMDTASAQVAEYIKSQGADPLSIKVTGMEVTHEDTLVIDPSSMEYYGAKYAEDATLKVAGPKGELQVAFKLHRETAYQY